MRLLALLLASGVLGGLFGSFGSLGGFFGLLGEDGSLSLFFGLAGGLEGSLGSFGGSDFLLDALFGLGDTGLFGLGGGRGGALEGSEGETDLLGAGLLSEHRLEAVEVGHGAASTLSSELLGPRGLGESLDEGFTVELLAFEDLAEGGRADSAGDLDSEGGEGEGLEVELLTVDTSVVNGTIDEGAVLVDDVNDGGELTSEFTVVDEDNTTDVNELVAVVAILSEELLGLLLLFNGLHHEIETRQAK